MQDKKNKKIIYGVTIIIITIALFATLDFLTKRENIKKQNNLASYEEVETKEVIKKYYTPSYPFNSLFIIYNKDDGNAQKLIKNIKETPVANLNPELIEYHSKEGKEFINAYQIKELPTLFWTINDKEYLKTYKLIDQKIFNENINYTTYAKLTNNIKDAMPGKKKNWFERLEGDLFK